MFKEYYDKKDKESEEDYIKPIKYVPLSGNWWKGKKSTKKEISDWFNSPLE